MDASINAQITIIANEMTKLDLYYKRPVVAIKSIHGEISMSDIEYKWTCETAKKQYKELEKIRNSLQKQLSNNSLLQ